MEGFGITSHKIYIIDNDTLDALHYISILVSSVSLTVAVFECYIATQLLRIRCWCVIGSRRSTKDAQEPLHTSAIQTEVLSQSIQ